MRVETANNLVELRKRNRLSQEALAEKIGVSRQAVSKWERAECSPDTDNLIALAQLYNVTLDDMLRGKVNNEEVDIGKINKQKDVKSKKIYWLKIFPYPALVTIVFFVTGFVWDLWNIGWMLYLTIPIWGAVIRFISMARNNKSLNT